MLKTCKHSNCAVCTNIKERNIFKPILKTNCPDTYICKYAMYKITNCNEGEFIIPSLQFVSEGKEGYFVRDMYTTMRIYLNKNNFEVVCSKQGECNVTDPYVEEYVPKHKSS